MSKKFIAVVILATAVLVVGALFLEGKFEKPKQVEINVYQSYTDPEDNRGVYVYHDDEYKCGLADKDGNIIAEAKWASISEFKNGYGIAAMGNGEVVDCWDITSRGKAQ